MQLACRITPLFHNLPYILLRPDPFSSQVQILGIGTHKRIPIIRIP
jgi:hypothetical protein